MTLAEPFDAPSIIPAYDNVAGNHFDKYNSRNPLVRAMMRGFFDSFDALCARTGVRRAFEAGCGEGQLSLRLAHRGWQVSGVDLEPSAVAEAQENARTRGLAVPFEVADLYALDRARAAPLVVSCEVLEHVPDPARALDALAQLADPWLLLSVPREPLWRALNMARGRYLGRWGNTPGHIQHWGRGGFARFVGSHPALDVVAVRSPLPWTMVLARRTGTGHAPRV